MSVRGERLFTALLWCYPREFRDAYRDDLVAFFAEDRQHPKYGRGPLRPLRFWMATLRDLVRAAWRVRRTTLVPRGDTPQPRWGGRMRADVRDGWRALRRAPSASLSALVLLTLGIGVGTSIFSVVDAVSLRGLPFPDGDRLAMISETLLKNGDRPISSAAPNYFEWRTRQHVFDDLGASVFAPRVTTADAPVEELRPVKVTASLFPLLRVRPALGRTLTPDDEAQGAAPVALISHALWQRRYHADPRVVGALLHVTGGPAIQIVGVMPDSFAYPLGTAAVRNVDLWTPFVPTDRDRARDGGRTYALTVIGRLRPGATLEEASTQMSQIRDALAVAYPKWFTDRGIVVRSLKSAIVGADVRNWMLLLLGAVGVVVLVTCLNVANLLLAHAAIRRRELAVRAALGASRWDLARGRLVESLLLSLVAAAGGTALAFWGVGLLRGTLPASLPALATIAVDLRVLGWTAAMAIVTGLAFGTVPALYVSRTEAADALREGGRAHTGGGGQGVRVTLVVAEVALAVMLLAGAGLFAASFARVVNVDLGFNPDDVVAVGVTPTVPPDVTGDARLAASQAQILAAFDRVRAIPGIVAATPLAGAMPMSGSWISESVRVGNASADPFTGDDAAVVHGVGDRYLETVRSRLLGGRWVREDDTRTSPLVVVLNDEAVRRYFQGRDPVGATIVLGTEPRTVVGVVRGIRIGGPESNMRPEAYVPFAQSNQPSADIVVRTSAAPAGVVPAVQAAIRDVLPGARIGRPEYMVDDFGALVAQRRFNMIVLGLFGILALAIATVGLYGLFAFLVAQRAREIGVRLALGARPAGILAMVLRRAGQLLMLGVCGGLAVSLWLERFVRTFLFNAAPHPGFVYAAAAGLLAVAGLLAAFAPALRAARVDPITVLRID